MTGYKLPMEVEATIQHQAGEIMQLKQQLADIQAKYDAREQECRVAFGKEMELRKQLATMTSSYDEQITLHNKTLDELAECERERDELKANSDRYELLRDMKLYEMQQYNCLPCAFEDSYDWFDEQTDAKIRERYPRATIGADKTGE